MSVCRVMFSILLYSFTSAIMLIRTPNANYSCSEENHFVCCICSHCKNKCQFVCSNCIWSEYNISGNCSTCSSNAYCNSTVYNTTGYNNTRVCLHADKDNSNNLGNLGYYILASIIFLSIIFGGMLFLAKKPKSPPVIEDRNSDEELTDVETVVDMEERFREFLGETDPKEKYKIHRKPRSPRNDTEGAASRSDQSREENQNPGPQGNSQPRRKRVIDVFYRIPSSIRDDSVAITIHKSFQENVGENGVGESRDDKPEVDVEGGRQQSTVEARLEDGDALEQTKAEISQPKHKKRTRVDFERESHKKDDITD